MSEEWGRPPWELATVGRPATLGEVIIWKLRYVRYAELRTKKIAGTTEVLVDNTGAGP